MPVELLQSPRDRINHFIKLYNEAHRANNVSEAIRWGNMAVKEAQDELKRDISDSWRATCQSIIADITPFLSDPDGMAVASAAAGSAPLGRNDAIKNTNWFDAPIPDLGIDDIAGLAKLKEAFLVNIFAAIHPQYRDIYRKFRGEENGLQVLLYGPPGTGKTHAVKCLAGALKCKIAVVQIKDVMANLVGDGAKIISEIFSQAREYERCILFFDELDGIASSREGDDSRHTKEQLTTLLTNMDGFTSKTKPGQLRIVIAATNRPWALDSAVKRGGRFETQIYVPLPDVQARKKLIEMALGVDPARKDAAKPPLAGDVTIDWLVEKTEGYAGADIKAICRAAVGYPMKREILARSRSRLETHCVQRGDFEAVISQYINSINDEMLMQFDAYSMNMELGSEYHRVKLAQLTAAIYGNYLFDRADAATRKAKGLERVTLEAFEERLYWDFYENEVAFLQLLKPEYKQDAVFMHYLKALYHKRRG